MLHFNWAALLVAFRSVATRRHLFIVFWLAVGSANALAQLVNQGSMAIAPGASVVSVGTLTNNGTLTNQGVLSLQANLTNTSTFSSAQGTVQLEGAVSQTVSSPTALTIQVLNLKNTAGGVGIVLATPLLVTQSASFSAGVMQTTAANLLVFADNAQAIGAGDVSHVVGPVQKIGDDSFTYPIGNITTYRPAYIGPQATATDVFTAQYFESSPPANSSLVCTQAVSSQEYWQITHTVGSGSAVVGVANQHVATNTFNLADPGLRVAHYTGTQWELVTNAANGGSSQGTVRTNGVVGQFGVFTLGLQGSEVAITQQPPASSVVCAGITLRIPVSVSGVSIGLQWYKDGAVVSGQQTATLTLSSLSIGNGGNYSLVVTGSCNSVTSSAFNLIVNAAPSVSITPANTALQPGGSVILTASGASSYSWSTGATSSTISVSPTQNTVYSVVGTDNGCSSLATATVAVCTQMLAQAISVDVPAVLGAGNCSVRITGQGQGNSFVFTGPGGYVFSNAYRMGGIYAVFAQEIKQPGTYTFTAYSRNACGEVTSDSRTFVVSGTACQ